MSRLNEQTSAQGPVVQEHYDNVAALDKGLKNGLHPWCGRKESLENAQKELDIISHPNHPAA